MFELEAEKQAKMLEIEAANAKTKAKEVALASMMTVLEICPRGNNKWLLLYFFVHDNCLLFML